MCARARARTHTHTCTPHLMAGCGFGGTRAGREKSLRARGFVQWMAHVAAYCVYLGGGPDGLGRGGLNGLWYGGGNRRRRPYLACEHVLAVRERHPSAEPGAHRHRPRPPCTHDGVQAADTLLSQQHNFASPSPRDKHAGCALRYGRAPANVHSTWHARKDSSACREQRTTRRGRWHGARCVWRDRVRVACASGEAQLCGTLLTLEEHDAEQRAREEPDA